MSLVENLAGRQCSFGGSLGRMVRWECVWFSIPGNCRGAQNQPPCQEDWFAGQQDWYQRGWGMRFGFEWSLLFLKCKIAGWFSLCWGKEMAARASVSYTLCASALPWRVRKVYDRLDYLPYSVATCLFMLWRELHAGESHLGSGAFGDVESEPDHRHLGLTSQSCWLKGCRGAAWGWQPHWGGGWSLAFGRPLLKRSSRIIASKSCTLMAMKLVTMRCRQATEEPCTGCMHCQTWSILLDA